tara:strand:+ start:177 stop:854 length:678 start_codon:yes stop_codon:yes gene_type:complete
MREIIFASKDNMWSNYLFKSLNGIYPNMFRVYEQKELQFLNLSKISHIFFFHWSEIVPPEIYENCECAVIHTAKLPQGRGGSPLQNQIIDGVLQSRVNLLKMAKEIDAGPIYCSSPITLQGSLFDIWFSIATISKKLITDCIEKSLKPIEQLSSIEKVYRRRKDNILPLDNKNTHAIYNFIQMLDAEGYPDANINVGNYSLFFSRAKMLNEDEIICDVKIKRKDL